MDKKIAESLCLTLTGSTVFGANKPHDEDWFGQYSPSVRHKLLSLGFQEKSYHYPKLHAIGFQKDRCDVFLFVNTVKLADYHRAHVLASNLKLRKVLPNKNDFMAVFTLMCGGDR